MVVLLQPVDAETQKAMMAFYHKKQEEQKVCVKPASTLLTGACGTSTLQLRCPGVIVSCLALQHLRSCPCRVAYER